MNTIKEKIWDYIDSNRDELLKLTTDLIKINSENPPGLMEAVTKYITDYFEKNDIKCEVLYPTKETPNIIASYGNNNGKCLILNGHSDVVPVGDLSKWDFDPFSGEIKDGKILGRGTSDMKAGLAGVIYALCLLKKFDVKLNGQVKLSVVPDEEVSGKYGTKWLVDNGYLKGDACIVAEPTDFDNCEIGQKGSVWIKLKSHGKSAHGSLSPHVGDNAIEKLMKVINGLTELRGVGECYPKEIEDVVLASKEAAERILKVPNIGKIIDHVTVNPGKISGGIKTNIVPDYAEAEIDIRIPIGVKSQTIIDKLETIIKENNFSGIEYEFLWRSEANYTPKTENIVDVLASNAKDVLGFEISRTYQWASSDARYFRYAGIPTLQYGPANTEGIHTYNETVDVCDVISCTKVYAGTIIDFLNN